MKAKQVKLRPRDSELDFDVTADMDVEIDDDVVTLYPKERIYLGPEAPPAPAGSASRVYAEEMRVLVRENERLRAAVRVLIGDPAGVVIEPGGIFGENPVGYNT